jgi:hypothetical protein
MIWEYLVSKDLLFSTDGFPDPQVHRRGSVHKLLYRGVARQGSGMDRFQDYRAVHEQQSRCDNAGADESMTDCQSILGGAKYNPK